MPTLDDVHSGKYLFDGIVVPLFTLLFSTCIATCIAVIVTRRANKKQVRFLT